MTDDTEDIFSSYNLYVCLLTLYLAGSIASAGGIGGGGVNVPLLLVLGRYEYHDAVVFSLCTVLGNHLAQSYINWPLSHPYVKERPLIYWDLILFLLPAQLGGSNLGVIVSDAPPELLLLICAFIVLLLAIGKTFYKFRSYYRQERKVKVKSKYQRLVTYASECEREREASHSHYSLQSDSLGEKDFTDNPDPALLASPLLLTPIAEEGGGERSSLLSANDFDFTAPETLMMPHLTTIPDSLLADTPPYSPVKNPDTLEQRNPLLAEGSSATSHTLSEDILLSSARPSSQDLPLTIHNPTSSAPARTFSSASNNHNGPPIQRLVPWSILIILLAVFLVYVIFFLIIQFTVTSCSRDYYLVLGSLYPFLLCFVYWARGFARRRQQTEAFLVKGDVDMEEQSVVLIVLIFCVGILSALLGIGGGELMGPLFLSYHLLPPVSTATTSMMSLLNTANSIVHYAISGDISYGVGVVFFVVGVAAGATGRYTALHLVMKYQKNSVIVLMLLTILCISAMLLVYEIATAEHDFHFHALC